MIALDIAVYVASSLVGAVIGTFIGRRLSEWHVKRGSDDGGAQ